jgi:HK97 family phage major capsid protein
MNTNTSLESSVAPAPSTEDQIRELQSSIAQIQTRWPDIESFPAALRSLEDQTARLAGQLADLRRSQLTRAVMSTAPRLPGQVSEDCARGIASAFILHCGKSDMLEALCSVPAQRDLLLAFARNTFGLSTRTALNTTDIPLPAQYGSQIRELISDFGVVRRRMSPYPIGMGTAKPARMGTRVAFGSIAMSAPFVEKSPTFGFASLESHKIGGVVRLPREIDEQSIVAMGQFLARYGAIEFSRAEDTWGFLADGGATFEQVHGIVKVARDTGHTHVLADTKTKPSDATLDDFRALRTHVDKAALNGRLSAYYLDTTWESHLPTFRTAAEPTVYQRLPNGSAILDGYPIVWTDILTPYGTAAAPDANLAVFGALSFWWMGEHGTPRIDTSQHVWFANDQLAVRFIEEIDFDYAAEDATAVLLTAAA